MKNIFKQTTLITSFIILLNSIGNGQSTLEWTSDGSANPPQGPSTTPRTVTFYKDLANANFGTIYSAYTPTLTATVSISNQQRSSILTGSSVVLPGLTFGGRNTASLGPTAGVQVVDNAQIYNTFSANIPVGLPVNSMFMSSPTAFPAPKTDDQGNGIGSNPIGRGLDVEAITGATGPNGGDNNYGLCFYSSVDPLFKANEAKDGRFYYGDIVIKFNRPVLNPVVHIGGLGGSYNFLPAPTAQNLNPNRQISYFSSELELVNTGLTSTLMAGNPIINLSGNNILNNSDTPNGGSVEDGTTSEGYSNYGAASGSVRINGTVQELVYRIYVRGSASSDFNFSKARASIAASAANRDPLNGDFWYLGISLDKPTQEISGTIFIDADGKDVDNNINSSAGVANTPTNVGGQLIAQLLNNNNRVVAETPVGSDGTYLFSDVPLLSTGNYSVQINKSSNTSPGSYASPGPVAALPELPDGWVNTGENVSDPTTTGTDGFVNGRLQVPFLTSEQVKVQNNFGIERAPESVGDVRRIKIPLNNQVVTLSPLSTDSAGLPLPVLLGSDPEDQPVIGPLTTKSVKINTLPVSVGANATLFYAGNPVAAGAVIQNYNPDLLKIRFTNVTFAPFVYLGSTSFTFSNIDAAGVVDPTPATYTLYWEKPVPVILEDFTTTKSNCVATLNWKTTAEINSDKFEIEMSTLTDPRFVKVGTVVAKGNSTTPSNYQTMFPMESGVVYNFRLKMINVDGSFGYSDIRVVSCTERQEISIKPNPSVDIFKITNMLKGKNVVSVLSSDSKLVSQYEFLATNGDINLAKMAKGIYIVKIENENGTTEVKRIVKN